MTRNGLLWIAVGSCLSLLSGCFSSGPIEENLSFHLDLNQPVLQSVEINGHTGRFVVASAISRTAIASRFADDEGLDPDESFSIGLGDKRSRRIRPQVIDLGEHIDALIGPDILGPVMVLDYRKGVVSSTTNRSLFENDAAQYRFRGLPAISVEVEGHSLRVLVDTAIPDTMILPSSLFSSAETGRTKVRLRIGNRTWEDVDVRVADTKAPRIGTRILQHYLVAIDYSRGRLGLWPYP